MSSGTPDQTTAKNILNIYRWVLNFFLFATASSFCKFKKMKPLISEIYGWDSSIQHILRPKLEWTARIPSSGYKIPQSPPSLKPSDLKVGFLGLERETGKEEKRKGAGKTLNPNPNFHFNLYFSDRFLVFDLSTCSSLDLLASLGSQRSPFCYSL